MVRGKLQLKRIEDKNSRHVTFSKRRTGLIKKAKELSVLCDVEVAVFVFSGKGKLYQFSTRDSLRKILDRCQMQKEADVACGSAQHAEKQKIPGKQMNTGCGTNPLLAVQRYLEEQKVEQLDVTEITQLEHKLDGILHQLKSKKSQLMMEAVSAVHEKEKQLKEVTHSTEQEIPAMLNEGVFQSQQPRQDDNNSLIIDDDFDELYASAGITPFYQQPFYML